MKKNSYVTQMIVNSQLTVKYIFIVLFMNLRNIAGMQGGREDLQLQFKPRSLLFQGTQKNTYFSLYLEKGMQIINKFSSGFDHNTKDLIYRFRNPQVKPCRVNNRAHTTYTWSLYKVDASDNSEQFVDSSSFDVNKSLKLYEQELIQKEREIQTSFIQKTINKSKILQTWKQVKSKMTTHRSFLKCLLAQTKIHLQFLLQIKNSLDLQIQRKIAEQEIKKSLRKTKSQSNIQITPLLVNPSEIKQNQQKYSDSGILDHQQKGNSLRKQLKKKQLKHNLQNSSINLVEIPCPDESKVCQQEYVATVKVMSPSGDQIFDQTVYNNKSKNQLSSTPKKKFSLLSDIVEQSCDGSSTYGNPNNSNGFNNFNPNFNETLEEVNQQSIAYPINKVNSLQNDHSNELELQQQFRRANTTDKLPISIKNNIAILSEEYYPEPSEVKTIQTVDTKDYTKIVSSKETNAKIIIFFVLFIIIGLLGAQWFLCCKDGAKKGGLKKHNRIRVK